MIDPLPFNVKYDYSYDGIIRAYEDNLQRLGLDRIDVLLVHDIGTFQHGKDNESYLRDLAQTGYRALIELKDAGLVSAIGLGVNENKICLDVMDIGLWDVFLLAGRYTLLEQTALAELFPMCAKQGTSIICGGPFNSGILVGRETWNYSKAPEKVIEKARQLNKLAQEHSIPLGAAAIQFPLANSIISSVIPGPRTKRELLQILDWYHTKIPNEFWSAVKKVGYSTNKPQSHNLV
jgi:D-threo-aldose 1-dehydrogenase